VHYEVDDLAKVGSPLVDICDENAEEGKYSMYGYI